jgi:hypothetical protein
MGVLVRETPGSAWPGGDELMSFDPDTVAVGSGTDPEYVHPSDVVRLNRSDLTFDWLVVVVDVETDVATVWVDAGLAAVPGDAALLDEPEAPHPAASNPTPTPIAPIAVRP